MDWWVLALLLGSQESFVGLRQQEVRMQVDVRGLALRHQAAHNSAL